MSNYDGKYRDLDMSYDEVMHSTPKKSREEYSSSVSSSYVPGELSKATENHISNVGQSEHVSTTGGVTRSVAQSVKKTTSVSSTRSSGYSSEEGKKDDDNGNSDVLNNRTRSSHDDIFSSDKSKHNTGFQYEDIKSFRERQKLEGDRLEMHRQSLTGNIVGTGKYGDMKSDYDSHSSSYSSALDNKSKDGDPSLFTSRVQNYMYSSDRRSSGDDLLSDLKSGDQKVESKLYSSTSQDYKVSSDRRSSRDDPLSKENLLAEARSQNKDLLSDSHSSSSSDYKVSSDRGSARDDALSRAENLLAEARNRNKNRQSGSSQEFRYSRGLSSSKEDITGSSKDKVPGSDRASSRDDPLSRENLLAEARKQGRDDPSSVHSSSSQEFRYSRVLSSSKEDITGSSKDKDSGSDRVTSRDDPLSRQNLLAEARKPGRDLPSSVHSSSSQEFRYSSGLSSSKEDITGSSKDKVPGSDRASSRDDPLSRENLLAEARKQGRDDPSSVHSSSSQEFRYSRGLSSSKEDITGSSKDKDSGSDRVTSRDDPLSRQNLLAEARKPGRDLPSSVHSSSSQEFRYSSGLSSSKEDITGSSKDKVSGSDRISARDDPLSRQNLLAEARKHEFRYSRGLSRSKEDISGSSKDGLSSDSRLHSTTSSSSIDDKYGKVGDLGSSQDERYTKSDALASKYLHSSRSKGLSKHGVDLDSDSKSYHSPLKDIKEETKSDTAKKDTSEIKHHSAGGRPMSYLSSSASYEDLLQKKRDDIAEGRDDGDKSDRIKRLSREIHDERKSRQSAIDRLLASTRRFKSSESLLDSSSRDDRQKPDEKASSYKYSSVLKDRDDKTDVLRRGSKDTDALKPKDNRRGSDGISSTGDKDRYHPRLSRDPDKPGHPDIHDTRNARDGGETGEEQIHKYTETSNYETPYTSLDHAYKPTHYTPGGLDDRRIYDKLNRGVDQGEKPRQEPGHPGSGASDKRRGSTEEIIIEPLYDHLSRRTRAPGSPVPISDRYSLPLDEYDKPVAVHGRPNDPSKPGEPGDRSIVSRHPELRDYGISDYKTERGNVTETTKTSITQRTFMSRDGEVIQDETTHHENVYQGGQNAIEGTERRESNPDLPTRIQRYPAAKADDIPKDRHTTSTEYTKTTEEDKRRREVRGTDRTREERRDVPKDSKLDDILKMAGIKDTGGTTKYHEQTRKDEVTRVGDDSNVRTRIHRTDVNTNVNIVKEVVKEKPKEKPRTSGIAGLRSKIEALRKSVDELMDYKHKTGLESYVAEHGERRPSQDILESLPKPEHYEVKSKRYEPKIEFDEVDYVHKEVELPESSQKPEISHSELNIEKMWMTEDQGIDIGLRIPKQINLVSDDKQKDWWSAPTAEDADRFLCIGDWQWWNANTTEGVDHILGIRAINKETGEAGAIIAKYQGDEKPIEWAWYQATQQPSPRQKRRTLTRVLTVDKDKMDGNEWWDAPTAEDADKYLSMGHHKWWDQNTEEGVDKVLGIQGSSEATGTVLATYKDGTKPTAWTWVQTPDEPDRPHDNKHFITHSSRDLYIDETTPNNVELLIRLKDEETTTHQQPRYVAIRPGPVEKAIIVREIQKGDLPELPDENEVTIEGREGEGLQVQDGVIKMQIKDMTPAERKAWVHIMGMERKGFKLHENETLEIPVRVVDRPKVYIDEAPVYAVPFKKKNKNKSQILQRSKSNEPDGKPKLKDNKETTSETKKKQKEIDAEQKKRELKAKKLEDEKKKQIEKESLKKKKSTDIEKKKKEKESQKKKKETDSVKKIKDTDSQRKKKETESQKKKKELEKMKERESKKEKKEKQSKRSSSVSSSNEKLADGAPLIDRSLKPKPNEVIHEETHVQETSSVRRSSSDEVDSVTGTNRQRGGSKQLSHVEVNAVRGSAKGTNTKATTQVGANTYSPTRKPGPFAIPIKGGLSGRPQSARARVTTRNESHKIHTVFEEKEAPARRQSPSIKVVKRINIAQSQKAPTRSTTKSEATRSKSDSLRRRSFGQVAVPLRGRSKHGEENMQVVASHQRSQSQRGPGQLIRQTRVEKTRKTYRTETKVVNPNDGNKVFSVKKSAPLPLEHSISGNKASVIRRNSGDPFKTDLIRRGSGHSVTNVSVSSRSNDGKPNVVQMTRRSSDDKSTPLQLQGSTSSDSVTNMSVSSRSTDGPQNVIHNVRRSSGDDLNSVPLERRGSNSNSVTNVSVSSRSTDGQNTIHNVRRSSGDDLNSVPLERRGSSSNSVTNVSVSSRSTDGQNIIHNVRRSSRDSVPLGRQESTRSLTNVSIDGVPLERHGSEFHSVERHSSSGHSNVVHARRPSGDPWKVDLHERRGSGEGHSMSNVSVHTASSSGQPFVVKGHGSTEQAAGFPPPPNMAMSSEQQFVVKGHGSTEQAAGFPPPPNMAMSSGQQFVVKGHGSTEQAAGFPPPPNMAMSSGQQFVVKGHGSTEQAAGFPPPPNMAMSSGQQISAIQEKGSVRSYGPGGHGEGHSVVKLHNQPTQSSSDVSYYTEGRQLPHGYVKKEVIRERKTEWAVEENPSNDQPATLDLYY